MSEHCCEHCDKVDEVMVHLAYIREKADETTQRLSDLNGRTRKLETQAAVHAAAIGLVGAASLALFGWLLSLVR